MMKRGVRCKICGDSIYSFHRHDFKWCACGNCFVDGGDDYFRFGVKENNSIKIISKEFKIRIVSNPKPSIDTIYREYIKTTQKTNKEDIGEWEED